MIEADKNTCLKLFSNCKIVEGFARACICDIQRNRIYTIPLTLSGIFDNSGTCKISEIEKDLDEESKVIFEDYLLFILEHELGYYCQTDELELFPDLSEEFLFPAQISNAIFDTEAKFEYLHDSIFEQLSFLGCHYIQLRCFNPIPLVDLQGVLDLILAASIKSVDIILPFDHNDPKFYTHIRKLVNENRKISCLTITNADQNEGLTDGEYGIGMIYKSTAIISSESHCGLIAQKLFSINIPTYMESLHHNTCLNRKISIDAEGNITNCPSMKESYGNICDTTLEEAINKPGFKKYWDIKKDDITKCKDCEFRHVCTDCRAYLDDPDDLYSAPLKCGYNPYTCEWEDWSTHPLKQQAIDHYNMRQIL